MAMGRASRRAPSPHSTKPSHQAPTQEGSLRSAGSPALHKDIEENQWRIQDFFEGRGAGFPSLSSVARMGRGIWYKLSCTLLTVTITGG